MSNDKIFEEEQKEIKAWKIKETGRITAEHSEGMVSFFFLGHIPNIAKVVFDFITSFFTAILEMLKNFIKVAIGILKEGISYLSKMPPELLILFGGVFLIAYHTIDEVKDTTKNAF